MKVGARALILLSAIIKLAVSQLFETPDGQHTVFTEEDGSNIKFQVQFTNPLSGYFAFGFGSSMADGEVFICWRNSDNTATVSHRKSTRRSLPSPIESSPVRVIEADTGRSGDNYVITFTRPKQVESELEIAATTESSIIWAQGELSSPFEPGSTIEIHTERDAVSGVRLISDQTRPPAPPPPPAESPDEDRTETTSSRSAHNDEQGSASREEREQQGPTAVDNNNSKQDQDIPSTWTESTSSASSSSSSNALLEYQKRTNLILAHGVLMTIAWMVMTPMAIAIARFFKSKKSWFAVHAGICIVGTALLHIAGFTCVYVAVRRDHFNINALGPTGGAHVALGLIMTAFLIVQCYLGPLIHYLYDPNRLKVPILDKVHWWVGRILFALAWITIILGFLEFQIETFVWIIIATWMVVVFSGFVVLGRKESSDKATNSYPTKRNHHVEEITHYVY